MAEWLGNGLQNRVQQFDSAWYLKNRLTLLRHTLKGFFFFFYIYTQKETIKTNKYESHT